MDIIFSQRIDRDRERQRRINTSGQAQHRALKTVLSYVVPHSQAKCPIDTFFPG